MPKAVGEDAVVDSPEGATHSPEDLSALIAQFTQLDWLRVKKAAMHFAKRCSQDWEDLQNEAFVRSLDGRRNCPKDVAVTTFLGNVIRSIASERDAADQHLELSEELEALQASDAGLTDLSQPTDPAAFTMDAQRMLEEIVASFDGDVTAETMFEGILERMEGQELRELLGLSQKEFDTRRRFVRRRINAYAERNRDAG